MFFDPDLLKQASLAFSLVLQATVLTFLGFFFGQWIDSLFLIPPYLQITCTFLGFSIGIYNLIFRIKQ